MDYSFDFNTNDKKSKWKKIIIKIVLWLVAIALAITAAWAIMNFALEQTNMADSGMEATLELDDTIIINRLSYINSDPERFDVIVFKKDGKEHSYYCIRRVIGLPGETVLIKDGCVYINDTLLEEPMVTDSIVLTGLAANKIVLDEDEFFVLGDNRNSAEDSRSVDIGNVSKSEIVGKAWLRTNKFGFISKLNLINEDEDEELEGNEENEASSENKENVDDSTQDSDKEE